MSVSMELVARSVALVAADGAASAAPQRVLVMPAGEHTVHGVTWIADRAAADETIADFVALGRDLVIDYEHQSLGGAHAGPGGIAPAAGWITALEWEEGVGLWAAVTWTERAAAMIAAREYRYLSPVLYVRRKDGRPIALGSAALTNDPAIAGMRPIAAARSMRERCECVAPHGSPASDRGRRGDNAMQKIASSLGLQDGADEAAVLGAIGELRARAERGDALRVAASGALGLAADAGQDVIVAAATRLRGAAESAVPAAEHTALLARVTALEAERVAARREAWLEAGVAAGKIVAATRGDWAAIYDRDADTAARLLAATPAAVRVGAVVGGGGGGDGRRARVTVIAAACSEYHADRRVQAVCSLRGYVADALRRAGHAASVKEDELLVVA